MHPYIAYRILLNSASMTRRPHETGNLGIARRLRRALAKLGS